MGRNALRAQTSLALAEMSVFSVNVINICFSKNCFVIGYLDTLGEMDLFYDKK